MRPPQRDLTGAYYRNYLARVSVSSKGINNNYGALTGCPSLGQSECLRTASCWDLRHAAAMSFLLCVTSVWEMPPATSPHQQQQLGFFQMQVEINSPESTKAPTSNWVSFSERGINHDLNGTLNSMNIQTAFRVEGKWSNIRMLCSREVEYIIVLLNYFWTAEFLSHLYSFQTAEIFIHLLNMVGRHLNVLNLIVRYQSNLKFILIVLHIPKIALFLPFCSWFKQYSTPPILILIRSIYFSSIKSPDSQKVFWKYYYNPPVFEFQFIYY